MRARVGSGLEPSCTTAMGWEGGGADASRHAATAPTGRIQATAAGGAAAGRAADCWGPPTADHAACARHPLAGALTTAGPAADACILGGRGGGGRTPNGGGQQITRPRSLEWRGVGPFWGPIWGHPPRLGPASAPTGGSCVANHSVRGPPIGCRAPDWRGAADRTRCSGS